MALTLFAYWNTVPLGLRTQTFRNFTSKEFMIKDKLNAKETAAATMNMNSGVVDESRIVGWYNVQHIRNGQVIWEEKFPNLVTTVGKNDLLNKYFSGAAYTQTVRMGLKGAGAAALGDTQASHAAWSEVGGTNAPAYTGNRPNITFNAASAGSISHTAQAFVFTSGGTVAGCFLNNGGSATKDDTTGILYSAGDFSSSRAVLAGDTLNVTYTASV
jgi:hypothetical protein